MRILLDTNAFIWTGIAPDRLGAHRGLVADAGNRRLLSVASSWEIAIKWATKKLPLPQHPARYVPEGIRRLAVTSVGIELEHVLGVADLPLHHRDPFDRLLIAQARTLGVPILTADRAFTAYDVELLLIE